MDNLRQTNNDPGHAWILNVGNQRTINFQVVNGQIQALVAQIINGQVVQHPQPIPENKIKATFGSVRTGLTWTFSNLNLAQKINVLRKNLTRNPYVQNGQEKFQGRFLTTVGSLEFFC